MNEVLASQLEIVGFNGSTLVECGRSLPIARRKSDKAHAVLDLTNGVPGVNWHGEDEAESLLASGRWTKFETPIFVPRACCDESDALAAQPMVVFADETVLDTADRLPRPPMFASEYMIWRRVEKHPSAVQAACASAASVEKLLNEWGKALLQRFEAMYGIGRDPEYLKRIADFALCAAKAKALRWRAYLYFSTVQEMDRVQSTFETFIQREFPDATWDDFIAERSGLCDVLGSAPPPATQPGPPSSGPASTRPKLTGIARAERIPEDELFAA